MQPLCNARKVERWLRESYNVLLQIKLLWNIIPLTAESSLICRYEGKSLRKSMRICMNLMDFDFRLHNVTLTDRLRFIRNIITPFYLRLSLDWYNLLYHNRLKIRQP